MPAPLLTFQGASLWASSILSHPASTKGKFRSITCPPLAKKQFSKFFFGVCIFQPFVLFFPLFSRQPQTLTYLQSPTNSLSHTNGCTNVLSRFFHDWQSTSSTIINTYCNAVSVTFRNQQPSISFLHRMVIRCLKRRINSSKIEYPPSAEKPFWKFGYEGILLMHAQWVVPWRIRIFSIINYPHWYWLRPCHDFLWPI